MSAKFAFVLAIICSWEAVYFPDVVLHLNDSYTDILVLSMSYDEGVAQFIPKACGQNYSHLHIK